MGKRSQALLDRMVIMVVLCAVIGM